ncbi:MAG: phosphoribosylanthranilate isomerase [Hyphomicrobiales bacterium]|nr:phosphoribosylanthranilate isomerase [Hyphomicrobiales bacterium]
MTVEVKICGLSTVAAVDCAVAAGAEYIGLNFYPPSPRYVAPQAAGELADRARGKSKIVALVVDADDTLLRQIADQVDPDFIQTHGSETPERIEQINQLLGKPVIKAMKVRAQDDIAGAVAFSDAAEMILYDAKAPDDLENALPGGNGIAFDWTLLTGNDGEVFMLSGGLDADNVAEAVKVTHAPIVDVSSGVESAPGEKNLDLIRKFIEAAKSAG